MCGKELPEAHCILPMREVQSQQSPMKVVHGVLDPSLTQWHIHITVVGRKLALNCSASCLACRTLYKARKSEVLPTSACTFVTCVVMQQITTCVTHTRSCTPEIFA